MFLGEAGVLAGGKEGHCQAWGQSLHPLTEARAPRSLGGPVGRDGGSWREELLFSVLVWRQWPLHAGR